MQPEALRELTKLNINSTKEMLERIRYRYNLKKTENNQKQFHITKVPQISKDILKCPNSRKERKKDRFKLLRVEKNRKCANILKEMKELEIYFFCKY